MAFTADENNIALAGFFKREFYRLGPIGFNMNLISRRDAFLYIVNNRHGFFASRIVARYDNDISKTASNFAHQRSLHRISVAARAENDPKPPLGESPRRLENFLKTVGRMGKVDIDFRGRRGLNVL